MKRKYLIFLGVLFLVSGIILKSITYCGLFAMTLIIVGVLFKWTYVLLSIKDKSYIPGWEILLLYGGLLVFFTGIYLRNHNFAIGLPIEITGLSMKVLFVVLFIRKKKKINLIR